MAEQQQARRPAHNKIPQDQDDLMMALARREVRASDAVREFLSKFPPEGEAGPPWSAAAVQRATFLYRHRLRRARAEADAAQPIVGSFVRVDDTGCVVLPYGVDGTTGKVATVRTDDPGLRAALDAAAGDQNAAIVTGGGLFIPSEADAAPVDDGAQAAPAGASTSAPVPASVPARTPPRVGDRVRVVGGCAALNAEGVVREVLPGSVETPVGVVFDQDTGLWFSPDQLAVLDGQSTGGEAPRAGGLDGEVRHAERERDEARAEADALRARVGKLDAEVAELGARLARGHEKVTTLTRELADARRAPDSDSALASKIAELSKRSQGFWAELEEARGKISALDETCEGLRARLQIANAEVDAAQAAKVQDMIAGPTESERRETIAEEFRRTAYAELEKLRGNKLDAANEPPIAPNLAQRYTEIMNLTASSLRECASANRSVSDALQALAAQQVDAVAAKDAEIASLKLHLEDLRRQAGLS